MKIPVFSSCARRNDDGRMKEFSDNAIHIFPSLARFPPSSAGGNSFCQIATTTTTTTEKR